MKLMLRISAPALRSPAARSKFSRLSVWLAFALASAAAHAGPLVYIVNGSQQFGTVDVASGAFQQIGPAGPEAGYFGLAPGLNGSLVTFSYSSNLYSIRPSTGVPTLIGATGLDDCTTPASPCGPTSNASLGGLNGKIYATDFQNRLYNLNSVSGAATLIGSTGIPPIPFVPGSLNPDGTINFYDEAIFGTGGKLYETFDALVFDLVTNSPVTTVVAPALYQIDPLTGHATRLGATELGIGAVAGVNGTYYAFNDLTSQIVTLDLADGNTKFVSNFDPGAGVIQGASPVPEPESMGLACIGIAAMVIVRLRKRHLFALSLGLCATAIGFGQGSSFTSIDYPGAISTTPWWISARGDIVGVYTSSGATHGFLLSGGQYSTIDYPGATGTEVYGINTQGDVTGVYTLAGARHGFLLSGGQFTSIDYPGATATEPGTLNARGDIVGDYIAAGVTHGVLLSGGQFSTIDFPGSSLTFLTGINSQGDITIAYSSAGVSHAGLLTDGDFTSWDFPGATFTNTTGINARGDIVGRYLAGGKSHGYLLSEGQFSTIDFPGATFSGATSINQRGDILGRYRNADGVTHGFLLANFRPACVGSAAAPQIAMTAGGPAVTHGIDFTLVTASKPAAAGEVLSVFATGLGPTRPSIDAGQPFPASPLAAVDSLVEVRVNGRSAVVLGAVGLPGTVDGYQVNFRVPAGAAKGLAAIQLSAGLVATTAVNIMVQ